MKKRIRKIYICVFILAIVWFLIQNMTVEVYASTNVKFTGTGVGTSSNPYVITTASELNQIRNNLEAYYALGNDIDLSNFDWIPIGSEKNPFTGNFDGRGYVISNLDIHIQADFDDMEETSIYGGMFGFISNSVVKNLGMENINYNISVGNYDRNGNAFVNIGGIAGGVKKSEISQCYVTGSIKNVVGKGIYVRSGAIGCIATDSSYISNSYSNVDMYTQGYSTNTMVAGVSAWLTDSTIEKCYVRGNITGKNTTGYVYAGGINASGGTGKVINNVSMLENLSASGYYCYKDKIGNYSNQNGNIELECNESKIQETSTYVNCGWDFSNIWTIQDGYPSLRVFDTYFKLEVDTNNFFHVGLPYIINNSSYKSQLYKDSLLTWNGTFQLYKYLGMERDENGNLPGVCHGIALSMCYGNQGYINFDQITSGATDYWSLGNPSLNSSMSDMIVYYHLTQLTSKGTATKTIDKNGWHTTSLSNRLRDFLVDLVNEAKASQEQERPFVFSFREGADGHSVVVCGYNWNSLKDCHEITIYDENSYTGTSSGGYITMTIPRDYSSFDFADANAEYDGNYKIQDVWTSLSYYGLEKIYNDISVISTLRTRVASTATNTTTIQITAGKNFKLENATGEWIKFDGTNYTGTMTVYECYSSGLDETMIWNITVDNSSSFKLSKASVGCELICAVGEQGYAIQADGADSIILSADKMEIEGTNYTLSGAVQSKSYDLIQLSADVEGNACITSGDEIKMEFEGQGENVSVTTCDNFESNEQKIDGTLDKIVVDDSGKIKDIESSEGENEIDIRETSISEIATQVYTGKAVIPVITVKDDSAVLVQNTDYTVTYKNNVNAGTATVTIAGLGKYTGEVTKTFLIKKAGNTITASNLTKKATTKAQTFNINAKAKGGKLTYKSNNSKISISNTGKVTIAANYVGTANITITAGDDNYETVTKSIKITVNKVSNTITASNFTKTYSTKKQTFSIGAKRKGKGKLTYSSNNAKVKVNSAGKVTVNAKFIGKATVTIKVAANGIYKAATKKITVTVNPTKTSISKVTNTKGKKLTISWNKNTVATGYQIQYSTKKTFLSVSRTMTIKKNSMTSKTITGLTKGKKYYVRIRTYKSVSGKKYYSGWSMAKNIKVSK